MMRGTPCLQPPMSYQSSLGLAISTTRPLTGNGRAHILLGRTWKSTHVLIGLLCAPRALLILLLGKHLYLRISGVTILVLNMRQHYYSRRPSRPIRCVDMCRTGRKPQIHAITRTYKVSMAHLLSQYRYLHLKNYFRFSEARNYP